ncbi:MAG: ATP-binding cassette domain-containing protein [Spirochaetota bacterium]
MGHEKVTRLTRRMDWRTMHTEAQSLLDQLDANFDSRERMGGLPVARHESEDLYRIADGLRESGVSVIFISHRMEDIWRLADRVTVFRDGKHVGCWRTEVCESIYGVEPADGGRIFVEGEEVTVDSPIRALEVGIGCLPEDRQQEGLVLEWEIGKNITLPSLEKFSRYGWLDEKREQIAAGELATKLDVRAPTIFTTASALSGGNQQKVVVAKVLSRTLKVIILDEPTKGVDVAAKAAICEIIGDLAEAGYGIIMVSSEMPEVLGMSDRIVVMKEGHVTARLVTRDASQEEILNAAMVVKTPAREGTAPVGGEV